MSPVRPPKKPAGNSRSDIIRSITTPLGFFVLALIVVEATLGIVLSASKLDADHVWSGFLWMVCTFIGVVLVVTSLTIFCPKNLLYGKEEYVNPALDPSALRDTIEDVIVKNVKPRCLNKPSV